MSQANADAAGNWQPYDQGIICGKAAPTVGVFRAGSFDGKWIPPLTGFSRNG